MNKQKVCATQLLRTSNGCEVGRLIATGETGAAENVTPLPITTRALEQHDCEPDPGKINLVRRLRLLFQQSLLKVMTGIGPVAARQPRVRDCEAAAGDPTRLRSFHRTHGAQRVWRC